MRIYLALSLADVEALASGGAVSSAAFVPASEDEGDEFAAFSQAGANGGVIAAEVDAADQPVRFEAVASFHLAVDDTGDLAWYAPQEIDSVLELLRAAATEPGTRPDQPA